MKDQHKGHHDKPHQQLTTKDNTLTSTQEVLYQKEFKQADSAVKNNQHKKQL